MKLLLPFIAFLLALQNLISAPRLPAIFSDHAVLQAEKPIRLWGWSDPHEVVTVSLGNRIATTTASDDGEWEIKLPAEPASTVPRNLVVQSQTGIIYRQDILIGEVWICSGQSNMEFRLSLSDDGEAHVNEADYPEIRLFKVPRKLREAEQADVDATWTQCSPETAKDITAVGYHFARKLHNQLKVPIGIIHAAHGASAIEAWIPKNTLEKEPGAASVFERTPTSEPRTPSLAWNGMIAPLASYSLRGILWYQGETNAHWGDPPEYSQTFPLLIHSWRRAWKDPELHTLFVQLPNYNYNSNPDGLIWPKLREQQLSGLTLPNTAMAVAIDLGDPNDIHPTNKLDVSHRLFLKALNLAYDQPIHHNGPTYVSHSFHGNQATIIFSTQIGSRLVLKSEDSGFELAGVDRNFVPATASLDGHTVRLTATGVNNPIAIRYAWSNNPTASVFDASGLPCAPFRTDHWEATGPRILSHPKSISATSKQLVELSTTALGANLNYQWLHNGQVLQGATDSKLVLSSVQSANAGIYRVLISNESFTVYSSEASLTIINEGEEVLLNPADSTTKGWSVNVIGGTTKVDTSNDEVAFLMTLDSSSRYPKLSFQPPEGTIDLAHHHEVRFKVWNNGNSTVNLTAWALSGSGWGGAPSSEQIKSPSGRISLTPGESKEVVIDLQQRYPGSDLEARCIDAAQITGFELILQPTNRGKLAVGAIRLAGTSALNPKSTIRKDVKAVKAGDPVPGERVLRILNGFAETRLHHILRLPKNWTPDRTYPIIVDYPGNVFFHKYCYSTGLTRNSNHGPAMVNGSDYILLQLPYIRSNGLEEENKGWGDPNRTVEYALAAIEETISQFGGDSNLILLTGFSRGAYGADYIGLRTPEIADIWHGFILSQGHPKSSGGWNGSSEGFYKRLARLGSRPAFLSRARWEGATQTNSADPGLGSNVHADVGFLEPSAAANRLEAWIQDVIANRPGTATLTGRVVNSMGQGIADVTVHSGIHRITTNEDGAFTLPGLTGDSRTVTFTGAAASPVDGYSIALSNNGYLAGDLIALD